MQLNNVLLRNVLRYHGDPLCP